MFLGGDTRTGKTTWARNLARHTYFGGGVNIDDIEPDAVYTVFDDIPWKFVPNKRQWFGGQLVFTITDKYRGKRRYVNGGHPSIYLFNRENDPRADMNPDEFKYFSENGVFIWLEKALF